MRLPADFRRLKPKRSKGGNLRIPLTHPVMLGPSPLRGEGIPFLGKSRRDRWVGIRLFSYSAEIEKAMTKA